MEKRPENYNTYSESKGNSTLIWVLGAIAAVLAVVLIVMSISKSKLVRSLNDEKEELTEQIKTLQQDYAGLSSDYEMINSQLDSSREEVNQLVERIKKTDATNRAKIRQYQRELGTLRSIMRHYIVQIDSLNTLNHKLTVDAAAARKEAAVTRKQNAELQKTVEDLSGKVDAGSIIHMTGLKADAYNKNNKKVDRSAAVERVMVSLTLSANSLAEKGPMRVYVIVKDPEEKVLTNAESRTVDFGGETLQTSASREVDYQGADVDMSIYLNGIQSYSKGIYTVQVLTEKYSLGSVQFMLR